MSSPTPISAETTTLTDAPDVTVSQEPNEQQSQSNSDEYSPKSIVLAKVKGYPPWPAMILEESLLPENIRSKKPKSVKQPAKRKLSKPVVILPVRFFSDDTYIWIKSNEIKPLTSEVINQFLGNDKKRKDKLLQFAYELANDPPDMELFIKWGSKGEPAEIPYVAEEEMEEEPEDEIEDDMDLEEEEEEEDYEEPATKKQKKSNKSAKATSAKSSKSKLAKTKAKAPPKEKTDPREEGYDSDWGLDEVKHYNYDEGNYIFDNEKEQIKFEEEFPAASTVMDELAKHHGQFDKLDMALTRQLLEEPIEEQDILQNIRKIKDLRLPKTVVAKSKVLKTFILTLRKPVEHFPHTKIKNEVRKIVLKWVDLTVDENNLQEMQALEEAEEAAKQQDKTATPDRDQTPIDGAHPAEHSTEHYTDHPADHPHDSNGIKTDPSDGQDPVAT